MKENNTPELKKAEWLAKWKEAQEFETPPAALKEAVEKMFATETEAFWALNAKHNAYFENFIFESGRFDGLIGDWII